MASAPRSPMIITHEGGMTLVAQVRSHRVVVDQPERGGGSDSGPTPIELLGASLGTCVAHYVQQFCHTRGIAPAGLRVEVEQRGETNPSRVGEFIVRVVPPSALPDDYLPMLEKVAQSCPAHNTLTLGAAVRVSIAAPLPVG